MYEDLMQWLSGLLKPKVKHENLKKFPLLKDLNVFELSLFRQICHHRHFAADEVLFEVKYPLEMIFLITKGEVEVLGKLQMGKSRIIKKHQHIGIIDMFHEVERSSTAKATVETDVLAVSRTDFLRFIRSNPKTGVKILHNVCLSLSSFIFMLTDEIEAMGESH